ncbi:hypothetical protein DICVIV_09258 [Dictyocaulus viviparus]|uniref:Uncharacterized protein n=1 Tax=Dictyocaulus viviparus TaxID=29172 RepID=A0A0D8XQV2_DICVI|nr:hypothetical protein DICVIV_09258 [Dictyocaulus viviparus]
MTVLEVQWLVGWLGDEVKKIVHQPKRMTERELNSGVEYGAFDSNHLQIDVGKSQNFVYIEINPSLLNECSYQMSDNEKSFSMSRRPNNGKYNKQQIVTCHHDEYCSMHGFQKMR